MPKSYIDKCLETLFMEYEGQVVLDISTKHELYIVAAMCPNIEDPDQPDYLEYQVSDGLPGTRGSSADFLSYEEAKEYFENEKKRGGSDPAEVAKSLFDLCIENTETLADDEEEVQLGVQLAYLMGSILKNEEYEAEVHYHKRFIQFLQEFLPLEHEAWNYVSLMLEDETSCPRLIKMELLAGDYMPKSFDIEMYKGLGKWAEILTKKKG